MHGDSISSVLVKEHEVILKALDALDKEINRAEGKGEINTDMLRRLLEFSRIFIDKCHHGKEEKCLFPCLEKRGIPRKGGPIGVMLQEHEMGRNLVKRISEKLEEYQKGLTDVKDIIALCVEYVELLRQHIYKENNILFPMGDNVVNEEDIQETIHCYEGKENEIGPETHHKMEKLAEELHNLVNK